MIAKRPVSPGLFGWQNDRLHAARFALFLSALPWALRPSTLLPFLTVHFNGGLGTDRSELDTGLRPTEGNGI